MIDAVTIRGAGVAGLCVATELAARGVAVSISDLSGPPGQHACSWWAGGMLAPYCEAEMAEEPVVRLGQEAADWWERQGVEVTRKGSLVVTLQRDRQEIDRFARRTDHHRLLGQDEIAGLEPDLAETYDRALYFRSEAHLSPRDALATLHDKFAGQYIEKEEPSSKSVTVICTGLEDQANLTDLRGVKGEMLVLRCPDVQIARPVRLLHPRFPLYIVPRGDDVYMIGATQIESQDRSRATARSVMELLSAAYALHPAFGEAEILEIGVDARPAFPDNLPRIRRRGRQIHVNGLFRHGFLLAPAMARMVADYLLDVTKPEVMDEDHGEW